MALDKEDILALISILKKGLEDDSDTPEEKVVSRNTNKKDISSSKKSSSKKKNKKVNKFSDMNEFNMHKEDIEIDK